MSGPRERMLTVLSRSKFLQSVLRRCDKRKMARLAVRG